MSGVSQSTRVCLSRVGYGTKEKFQRNNERYKKKKVRIGLTQRKLKKDRGKNELLFFKTLKFVVEVVPENWFQVQFLFFQCQGCYNIS